MGEIQRMYAQEYGRRLLPSMELETDPVKVAELEEAFFGGFNSELEALNEKDAGLIMEAAKKAGLE